jgi:hypothetical protein
VKSQEIKQLIDQFDSRRRGAVAESIRHTVEATDALTRATLLNALGALQTAEAIESLTTLLQGAINGTVCEYGVSEDIPAPAPGELPDLSPERVSIPK